MSTTNTSLRFIDMQNLLYNLINWILQAFNYGIKQLDWLVLKWNYGKTHSFKFVRINDPLNYLT